MNKQEFIEQLRKGLSGLPKDDIEERLMFYSEMIDDRVEEGVCEETAVCEIGNVDEIVSQIISDIPITKLVKEKIRPKKKMRVWEIVLLILSSPIWISFSIAAIAVILSLYVVLWSVIVSLWAMFVSFAACGFAGIVAGIRFFIIGKGLTGIAMIGAGIICAGLSVLMFFACKIITIYILCITKKLVIRIKNRFIKKEEE